MKNTTWTVIALLTLINIWLLDTVGNHNWYGLRAILWIDALILALYGIAWIVYRKKQGKK